MLLKHFDYKQQRTFADHVVQRNDITDDSIRTKQLKALQKARKIVIVSQPVLPQAICLAAAGEVQFTNSNKSIICCL